jgi:predicted transcriptional regulator
VDPNKSDVKHSQLGPLEKHVLGVLCHRKDATVRELLSAGDVDAAYTTIMTTLDRLYKKGLLDREADGQGRAYRYRLKHSKQQLYQTVFGPGLSQLLQSATNPSLPVSFLVDTVAEHDVALLDELHRAVNRKRQELRRREKS